MKIGEPTFEAPTQSATIQRANEIERALLECEVGQWLPVEFDRKGQQTVTVPVLRKRGFTTRPGARGSAQIFVQAPANARPHQHRWIIPPGVRDATTVDQRCACGEVKPAQPASGEDDPSVAIIDEIAKAASA